MAFDPIDKILAGRPGDAAWELFHESSKMSRHERHSFFSLPPSDAMVIGTMTKLLPVKPYRDRPKLALPDDLPASRRSFDEVLVQRETARAFTDRPLLLEELAKILFMSYGVTRDNAGTHFPRPFRTIPSGGALYPLEIYVHATRVRGVEAGLYHYDPEDHTLDELRRGDDSASISELLFQRELAREAAAIVFVSAVFLRSTFKYGERGYRFVLLEAGHLAQNSILTARELGLAMAPIGGYLDRDVDRYLGLDGVAESTVYMLLLGRAPEVAPEPHAADTY